MNKVYAIKTTYDSEGAMFSALGQLVMPGFDCPKCGCVGGGTSVWYASLQPTTIEARKLCEAGLPENVDSPEEYLRIREVVQTAFQTDVRLLPGDILGGQPVPVRSRSTRSGLNTKKLRTGTDFLWGSVFNLVVSRRMFDLFEQSEIKLPCGAVVFESGDTTFEGYRVLELQPQPVWSKAERIRYKVSFCDVCGSSLKGVSGGTFKKKEFEASIFREGFVMVRGSEDNNVYINEKFFELLNKHKPTGTRIEHAGSW